MFIVTKAMFESAITLLVVCYVLSRLHIIFIFIFVDRFCVSVCREGGGGTFCYEPNTTPSFDLTTFFSFLFVVRFDSAYI